jgi:hypothetical protein
MLYMVEVAQDHLLAMELTTEQPLQVVLVAIQMLVLAET